MSGDPLAAGNQLIPAALRPAAHHGIEISDQINSLSWRPVKTQEVEMLSRLSQVQVVTINYRTSMHRLDYSEMLIYLGKMLFLCALTPPHES